MIFTYVSRFYGYVYLEKLRRFCEMLGNKRFTTTFWVFSSRHFGQYISKYALSMYITKTIFFVHWFNYTFTIHKIFSLFVIFKEWRYKIYGFLYSTLYITLDIAYDTSLLHIDIFLLGMIFLLFHKLRAFPRKLVFYIIFSSEL